MKNKLIDLNDYLFQQLERLNDEDIKGEALQEEITRSKAVSGVASNIVNNAKLVLEAEKLKQNNRNGGDQYTPPKMLESDHK